MSALGPRHLAAPVLVALVVALAAAQPLAADFADRYKEGLEALEAGRHADAAAAFREAIAERPEARQRMLLRLGRRPYLPHYQLGVALYGMGDCRAALEAFAEAESQGVAAGEAGAAADLIAKRQDCRQRLERITAARRRVEEALSRADAAAAGVDRLAESAALRAVWEEGSPSLADRQIEGEQRRSDARRQLAAAGDDLQALAAATDTAERARGLLAEVESLARARGDEIAERRQDVRQQIGELVARSRQSLERVRYLAPYPPRLARERQRLLQLLAENAVPGSGAAPAELESYRSELDRARRRLLSAAAPPPEELLAAATAFFAGDHAAVLETLVDGDFRDSRATAHAHLLRAAAHYGLWVAGGEREPEILERARAEALACRATDPDLTPFDGAFSPRFAEFFAAQRPDEDDPS